LIVGEIRKRDTVSIKDFYARRAKRLLPLSAFVLVVIGVMALIVFSTVRQVEVGSNILAAALYFVNWQFIAQDVDYFAFDEGMTSPVQHYWSLSVEEQFYLLWPLLLLAVATFTVRKGRSFKGVTLAILVPMAIASLAYSLYYTGVEPQRAYFSTLTRGWELAFGGILALLLPRATRIPKQASTLLVGGGILAILGSSYLFAETDPYPSWRALVPVLGTMAVITGGSSIARGAAVSFLAARPFQYLGKVSYAWYLWHWPFVVFAVAMFGELTPFWLLVATLVAWIPTEISHRLVEEPFRRSRYLNLRPRKALAIGAVCTTATIAVGITLSTDRIQVESAPELAVAGALAVGTDFAPEDSVEKIRPIPTEARNDRGRAYDEGCLAVGDQLVSADCVFGDAESDRTVVVLGDSHALQYLPGMRRIAEEKGFRLVGLTRGRCVVADVDYRERCDRWRENSLRRIETGESPDLVVISTGTDDRYLVNRGDRKLSRDESQPYLTSGLARTINRIRKTGSRVVVVRDQTRVPFPPNECVGDNLNDLRKCDFRPDRRSEWAFDRDAARVAGVKLIDPERILCPGGTCPSVIGGALVYRDSYHLSATFSRTLAKWLERRLPDPA
jgi:peptidoglycan/LPS O-acetylase OafA/YrhL